MVIFSHLNVSCFVAIQFRSRSTKKSRRAERNNLIIGFEGSLWAFVALEESIAGRIVEPRVVVRASYARLQVQSLPGNFLSCQFAGVWNQAGWLGADFDRALLLPRVEVFNFRRLARILNPLELIFMKTQENFVTFGGLTWMTWVIVTK